MMSGYRDCNNDDDHHHFESATIHDSPILNHFVETQKSIVLLPLPQDVGFVPLVRLNKLSIWEHNST